MAPLASFQWAAGPLDPLSRGRRRTPGRTARLKVVQVRRRGIDTADPVPYTGRDGDRDDP